MSNIAFLVTDIYDLLKKGVVLSPAQKEELGKELVAAALQGIGPDEQRNELRMSNFGTKCNRRLWFQVNTPGEAEPLAPNVKFMFSYGHILEALTLFLGKLTGKHKIEGRQDELEVAGVKGHRDAVIDGVLVDVKSANSRGMAKFREHEVEIDDPFGYLDQLNLYAKGSEHDPLVTVKGEAAFLAVDKELGHIVLDRYKIDRTRDWEKEISQKKELLALPDPPPIPFKPRPFGKSGNEEIPLQCKYCPYKRTCWKGKLRAFLYSSGLVYLTKVVKTPDVEEIKLETLQEKAYEDREVPIPS